MADKYNKHYRNSSPRLKNWNYSAEGYYFITICTRHRDSWFGNIINGKMILSEVGRIAEKNWQAIPDHFPHILLNEFVIMPDHIHGIIRIKTDISPRVRGPHEIRWVDVSRGVNAGMPNLDVPTENVETENVETGNGQTNTESDKNDHWKSGNLGVIINQYKRICTIQSRKITPQFAWQARYYDRIIRDNEALYRIGQYIKNNPQNWHYDQDFESVVP